MDAKQLAAFEAQTEAIIKSASATAESNITLNSILATLEKMPTKENFIALAEKIDESELRLERKIDEKVQNAVQKGKEKRSQSLVVAGSLLVFLTLIHDVLIVLFAMVILDKMPVPEFLDWLKWLLAGGGAFGAKFMLEWLGIGKRASK